MSTKGSLVDYTGKKFGRREVLGFVDRDKHGHARWKVRCSCGHELVSLTQNLQRTSGCPFCSHKELRPYRRLRPYEILYNLLVSRTKRVGRTAEAVRHSVLITYEQFVPFTSIYECHYCGDKIVWSEHPRKGQTTAANLDRMDNNRPYELGNLVVCCLRCNKAKNTHFTYAEWLQIGRLIRSWKHQMAGCCGLCAPAFGRKHPDGVCDVMDGAVHTQNEACVNFKEEK